MLINLGDIIMICFVFTIIFFVTLALMKLCHNMTSAYSKLISFRNQFSMDHTLLFAQIIFLGVCLCSMLNLFDPDTKTFPGIIGLILAAVLQCVCILFMLFFVAFLLKNFDKLKEDSFKKRYLSLYDGLKIETRWSAVANFVWLLRSFIFTILVMTAQDYPKI